MLFKSSDGGANNLIPFKMSQIEEQAPYGEKAYDSSFFDDDKLDFIPEDPYPRRTLTSVPSMTKPKMVDVDLQEQNEAKSPLLGRK